MIKKISIFFIILVYIFLAAPFLEAAVGYVTNTNDSGAGSLRQVIADATAGDEIIISVSGTISLSSTLTIGKNLTLTGPGANVLSISGSNSVRVLSITAGTVVITGVKITSGSAPGVHGAGVNVSGGTVTFRYCSITGNSTGAGLGDGAGIYFNSANTLLMEYCEISSNTAGTGFGGGCTINNGSATFNACTFANNQADEGGGIYSPVNITINGCTIANNTGEYDGGGVVIDTGVTLSIRNTIIANNTDNDSLDNTPDISNVNGGTFSSGGYNHIRTVGDSTFTSTTGDVTGTDPLLNAFGLNSGTTQTYSLNAASPVINQIPSAGSYNNAPSTDQRGFGRNGNYDKGAYEYSSVEPEINLQGNGQNIVDGDSSPDSADHTQFGTVQTTGGTQDRTFTIQNSGSAGLTILSVWFDGANPADFSVTSGPAALSTIAGSSSTTVTVRFDPSADGTRTATMHVSNLDANEQPYDFALEGAGDSTAPEINVKQGTTDIADGTGSYDFSSHAVSSNTDITFTVENPGTANLTVGTITLGGTNSDQFSVQQEPTSPVTPGGTTTFIIRFTPTSYGVKNATISFTNNDADENPYNFAITGTGTASEANVKQGVTDIADGTGSYDFSNHDVSSNTDIVFTIENIGNSNLTVGTVSLGGVNADQFSVQAQPTSPVAGSGTTTFTIRFTPTSLGAKNATISFSTNDSDENPYNFAITGTGTAPEANVKQGTTDIADGSGSYDYGSQSAGSNTDIVFTVENTGNSNLTVGSVSLGGTDASEFSIQAQPGSPVAGSGSTTFTIRFSPTSYGTKNATVSFATNDSDENPYNFALTGTGTAPEANVKQGTTDIADGTGSYDFSSHTVGSNTDIVFTLENLGNVNLTAGSITLGGADAGEFSVQAEPGSPVSGASSTTFTIRFTPTSYGTKNATVSFVTNDSNENPYNFAITGTGTEPEANVKQGATDIADGTGSYDFSSHDVSSNTDIVFTIENIGNLNLTVGTVSLGGTDAGQFSIQAQPTSPVAGSGTTTFTIRFSPTSLGVKNATISFSTNDSNENPYNFAITGTGTAPEANVKQGTTDIADGTGSYDYGNHAASSNTDIVFTVENTGNSNLTVGTVSLGGTDAGEFSIQAQPGSPVAGSGSTTFTIRFTPTTYGTKNATVSFSTNDSDENPYNFAITGTGTAPEANVKQGTTDITDGTGSYDFSSHGVGSNTNIIFTVENIGNSDLTAGSITLGGADAGEFSVQAQPGSPVTGGSTTTFTIRFSPTSYGTKNATISFATNDSDENPYNFAITGTGTAPEANVKQGATDIADGTGSYDFSNHDVGTNTDIVFTVENIGNSNLTVGSISLGGTDAGQFSVQAQPGSPVSGSSSTTFTIRFSPTTLGAKNATISFTTNDSDENPYNFALTGTGVAPEANVKQGTTDIADGTGSYDYGSHAANSNTDIVFTVENTGNSNLTVGTVSLGGTDAGQFSVQAQPTSPVAGSGSTTFTVRFTPTSYGSKNATLSFTTNDSNENPYNFALTGTGTAPEINVKQGTTDITDGTGSYDFSSHAVNSNTDIIFTVENIGNSDLTVGSITLGGTDAGEFSVQAQPGSPVSGSNSTTFTIRFTPTSYGSKSATISFTNSDSDENPYNFAITGTGTAPEANVQQSATDIADGSGSYDYGNQAVGSNTDVVFTVQNIGNSNLTVGSISLGGTDAGQFSVQVQPGSPVTGGNSTSFTIRFTPTSLGVKNATISFTTNDSDENPYNFAISGTGTDPEANVKQGATDIADNTGSFDFGSHNAGTNTDIVFTVENLGNFNLTPGTVTLAGTNASEFSIQVQPGSPVAPAGSTTFTIRFSPVSYGAKSATVSFATNDSDENPYNFAVTATGIAPEANVQQGAIDIASTTGIYSYGSHAMGSNSDTVFTIQNLGNADLTVGTVTLGGTDAAEFSVQAQPGTPVASSGTTTFSVRFSPTSIGAKTATISFATNDGDENPYTFTIQGNGQVILPTVTTAVASGVTANSATVGGTVTSDGGGTVTARGVCWGTTTNPTIAGNKTNNGTGLGAFSGTLTGLNENTTYYIRAYATNGTGTAYGVERQFTTNTETLTVYITQPQNGVSVSGMQTIKVNVLSASADNAEGSIQAVGRVEIYIDNVLLATDMTVPYEASWDTAQASNGPHTIKAVAYNLANQTSQAVITVNVNNGPPQIVPTRTRYNFGFVYVPGGSYQSGTQTVLFNNVGGGIFYWTIQESSTWLSVSPVSGTGNGYTILTVTPSGLTPGNYSTVVTIADTATLTPLTTIDVYLTVYAQGTAAPPYGVIDLPAEGAVVQGSIPVTGWALDDIVVTWVKLYRDPVAGEGTGLIYIDEAVKVEGARPDVEAAYPGVPKNYQAGWGYNLLTNVLPNGGNGTYKIYAVARDAEGSEVVLGSRTFTGDNVNAVKPFGTIDNPKQGQRISGTNYVNNGWALTPQPNMIPVDGSTILVWVDGVPLGHPQYNQFRQDILDNFPGYLNSNGAVGNYYINTKQYANGVHTISWSVTDNAGNTDGIGSRHFSILNLGQPDVNDSTEEAVSLQGVTMGNSHLQETNLSMEPVFARRGYDSNREMEVLYPGSEGTIEVNMLEGERLEIVVRDPGLETGDTRVFTLGCSLINGHTTVLPVGSTLDPVNGVFYWQPINAFIGQYTLVFIDQTSDNEAMMKMVKVFIHPRK